MKAIHGSKSKNDKIDSHKIASLLRGGLLPQSYVYPATMGATRDLLRRRLHGNKDGTEQERDSASIQRSRFAFRRAGFGRRPDGEDLRS